MKKFLMLAVMAIMAFSANAITLFPFFVDVAGDYKDGTCQELIEISGDDATACMYSAHPSFYKNIKEAKDFYKDVLPFSNETIIMKDVDAADHKATIIMSPMLDDIISVIYLFEHPEKGFFICYDEKPAPKR